MTFGFSRVMVLCQNISADISTNFMIMNSEDALTLWSLHIKCLPDPDLILLHFRSAGRTSVAVSFSCDFVSSSYLESKFYSSSMSISVVPDPPLALGIPMTWILPPYYITSSVLPLSSESHGKEILKGNFVYSLLRACGEKSGTILNDAISVKDDRIITGGSNDLACIQVKDRSTARTEIASCVKVMEV